MIIPTTKSSVNNIIAAEGNCTLVISHAVECAIRKLCSTLPDTEWSGILFYTKKGSFEDNNLTLTAVHVLLLDIGSTVYTSFKDNEKIIGYMCEHPELLNDGVYEGLIHSHHSMTTTFSGTDMSTLATEGSERNHFLSLIVNNAGNYSAKLTRKVLKKVSRDTVIKTISSSSYKTWDDITVIIEDNKKSADKRHEDTVSEIIEYYTPNIVKETYNTDLSELDITVSELLNANKEKAHASYDYTKYTLPPYMSKWSASTKPVTSNKDSVLYMLLSVLISGDIFNKTYVRNEADLAYRLKDIDSKYEKLFGFSFIQDKSTDNHREHSSFICWVDSHVEHVVCSCSDEDAKALSGQQYAEKECRVALALANALTAYNTYRVVDTFINALKGYIFEDTEEILTL